MEPVYTLAQIKEHWQSYRTESRYKILKDGKWFVRKTAPDPSNEPVTRVEMVKACNVMSFPKFLEVINA